MRATLVKLVLAVALVAAPTAIAWADAGDDQFAVAAGHYSAQRWELASQEFAKFLADHPEHAKQTKATFFLGETLVQLGNFDEAHRQFAAVLAAEPDSRGETSPDSNEPKAPAAAGRYARQALFRAGECAFLAGKSDDALRSLTTFREQYRDDALSAYALHYLGELSLRAGDAQTAKQHYQAAIAQFPDGPTADDCRLGLAQTELALKEYSQATETLQSLLKRERLIVEAHYWLGQVHRAQSQWDSAANAFRAAIAADPQHAGIETLRYQAAESLVRAAKYIEAIQLLIGERQQGLSSLPADQTYLVALAQQGSEKHEAALETLDSLTDELDGQLAGNVLLANATSLVALARNRDAIRPLEDYLVRYPDDSRAPAAAMALAEVREQLEQFDAALVAYGFIIDKHQASEQMPLALLRAANLHDSLQQETKAIELYERLVNDFADSTHVPAALYGWAWCLRDLKQANEANAKFEQLHRDHATSEYWADATYRLAQAAAQAKEFGRAMKLLADLIDGTDKQADATAVMSDADGRVAVSDEEETQPAPAAARADRKVPPETLRYALYLRAQVAIAQAQWDQAENDLQRLNTEHADSPLDLPAEFLLADVAYRRGDYAQAGERFAALSPKVAQRSDRWIPMVPLRRAQVLAQQMLWSEARALAEQIPKDYPEFDQQYEVDYLVGRCHAAEANLDEARRWYQKAVQSPHAGKVETAAMAQWMIGETYFLQEQYAAAVREYLRVEVLYGYPHWQAAALLQAGKCYEQLGQWSDAGDAYSRLLQLHPQSEFAAEARERLSTAQARTASRKKR